MTSERAPWSPDPQWADPLIALLATFGLLACLLLLAARGAAAAANPMESAIQRLPMMAKALGGLITLLLGGGGLVCALFLALTRKEPRPEPPAWGMSGRAVALVFLGWFCVYLLVNAGTALLLQSHPQWRLPALPLSYALHAAIGLWMVARAEGVGLRGLVAKVAPGAALPQLLWVPPFLALGFASALLATLIFAPLLRHAPGSQTQLIELLRSARGPVWSLLMLLMVSGLAPLFEETLMRGFLLPWMGARWGWGRGLLASSLLFGLIHMQLKALPALSALGFALGLAAWRTGSLRTSIGVHSLWNGAIFVLVRVLAV